MTKCMQKEFLLIHMETEIKTFKIKNATGYLFCRYQKDLDCELRQSFLLDFSEIVQVIDLGKNLMFAHFKFLCPHIQDWTAYCFLSCLCVCLSICLYACLPVFQFVI